MTSGIEPEVKKYLRKVGYSFFAGLLWLLFNVTLGLYFKWAIIDIKLSVLNIIYYILFLASIGSLLFYLYRTWKK